MKTLKPIAAIILCLSAAGDLRPQSLLVPILQWNCPSAYLSQYHDSVMASLRPVSIDEGDSKILFEWQDSSTHTESDIRFVRVWALIDAGTQITVASGIDPENFETLVCTDASKHGYGAYDYRFRTLFNSPSTYILVARFARKQDLSMNGNGHALIDCVEVIPLVNNSVELTSKLSGQTNGDSRSTLWRDVMGRNYTSLKYVPSGVYFGNLGDKRIIIR